MKYLFIAVISFFSCHTWAVKASVDVFRFSNLQQQYIEVNYRIFFNSLGANEDTSAMQVKEVLSTIMIYQLGEIVDYQKNLLVGGQGNKDLLDLRRFVLEPGDYKVVIELENKKSEDNIFKVEKRIHIDKAIDKDLSDVMLLATAQQSNVESSMVRNGVYLETMPYAYYDENVDVLKAYMEVYGLQNTEKYYCSYEIIAGYDTDPQKVEVVKYKRLDSREMQAHLLKLDISNLVSGNYHFSLKLYNSEKVLLTSKSANLVRANTKADMKKLCQRSDKFKYSFAKEIDVDSLDYYLMAMSPIVYEPRRALLDQLLQNENQVAKRSFIHSYWKERSGDNAEGACIAYMKIARAVDKRFFNGTSFGFDTDLGYIFLRYGKPDNALIVDDELSAYPYQIWRYEKIIDTGENNVKFLFYAPSLSHRDFRLLHSTCRVELQNPSWEAELYRKIPEEQTGNPSEVRAVNDGFTRRAKDLWNDF